MRVAILGVIGMQVHRNRASREAHLLAGYSPTIRVTMSGRVGISLLALCLAATACDAAISIFEVLSCSPTP